MQLICMLRKMKTITFAKELDKVSKMATREKIHSKEIHLPAKSQDCDTLQFGNI